MPTATTRLITADIVQSAGPVSGANHAYNIGTEKPGMLFSTTRDVNAGTPGITFSVDDVAPAAQPRAMHEFKNAFANRSGREVLAMAESQRLVLESPPVRQRRLYQALHGLIETVHLAFAEHRPLILSPDCMWMVISQGFSHHINQDTDKYRARLVKHEGKEELTVLRHPGDSWADAITQISTQIRERTDPVLHETLLCDFSTTTPAIRTASEIVLMDVYQAYFEYMIMCVCGIPQITLQGAAADWRRIRARVADSGGRAERRLLAGDHQAPKGLRWQCDYRLDCRSVPLPE